MLEKLQKSLKNMVDQEIEKDVFSGCCIGVLDEGKKYVFPFGTSGREVNSEPVDQNTAFDLASLTKPLVTSLSLLSLVENGDISLDEPLSNFFRCKREHCEEITLQHLSEHGAGFVAHREFFNDLIGIKEGERKGRLLEMILDEELIYLPGKGFLYSDLGFMLLGMVIEKVSGVSLDQYWKKNVLSPLGFENSLFFTNSKSASATTFCSTGVCPWSNMELYGRVNDDNCRALGGVAGHAGLFGTGKGVLLLCEKLLEMYLGEYVHPSLSLRPLKERFTEKIERWALGFDTPTGPVSSSGHYFSSNTIGHLGFTGTSFWIDLEKKRAVVFLTNRVLGGGDMSHIQAVRPKIHDCIIEVLTGQ